MHALLWRASSSLKGGKEEVELAGEKGVLSTMNMAGLIEFFGLHVSNA